MMKITTTVLFVASLFMFAGCVSTQDIQVESATNEKVNLKGYKTYQFVEGSGIVDADAKGNLKESKDSTAAMIEEIINDALEDKGKKPVAKDPDFYVAYLGGRDMHAVEEKLDASGKKIIASKPEAALLLMLIDAQTGAILRLATAEGEVKSLPQAKKYERIKYAVTKMLKDI